MNNTLSRRLTDIVNHAYHTVPMYRELIPQLYITEENIHNEFYKLPLIHKSMIQRQTQDAISEQYSCIPFHADIMLERTSGSTGKYLKVAWQKKDEIMAGMELWKKRYEYYGITPRDRYCYFYTTTYARNKLVKSQQEVREIHNRSLGFCKLGLTDERLGEICEKMFAFQPVWLALQPSMALILADFVRRSGKRWTNNLRCVEVSGEMLMESTRHYLEETFECPVYNLYGTTEVKGIALDFEGNGFRVLNSNVYVEIIRADGEKEGSFGDIYVTSLNNSVMPFIRYETGDRGRFVTNEKGEQILELERCRSTELITLKDGKKIPPYIFINPIEHINEKIGSIITQFQIVQKEMNLFLVRLALKENYMGWEQTMKEEFIRYLGEKQLSEAEFIFEFSPNTLPVNERGKLPYFVSEI